MCGILLIETYKSCTITCIILHKNLNWFIFQEVTLFASCLTYLQFIVLDFYIWCGMYLNMCLSSNQLPVVQPTRKGQTSHTQVLNPIFRNRFWNQSIILNGLTNKIFPNNFIVNFYDRFSNQDWPYVERWNQRNSL